VGPRFGLNAVDRREFLPLPRLELQSVGRVAYCTIQASRVYDGSSKILPKRRETSTGQAQKSVVITVADLRTADLTSLLHEELEFCI
jgi:hypothetical protein